MDLQIRYCERRKLQIYIIVILLYNTNLGSKHITYSAKMAFYPNQVTSVIIPADLEPIHTTRLYLRPLTAADAAAIFEIRRRQDVADWL